MLIALKSPTFSDDQRKHGKLLLLDYSKQAKVFCEYA